jgi:hypothetical protein
MEVYRKNNKSGCAMGHSRRSLSKKYDFAPSQSLPCVKGGGPPNGGSEGLFQKNNQISEFFEKTYIFLSPQSKITDF